MLTNVRKRLPTCARSPISTTRPAYVTGEPIHIHDLFRYVEEDGKLLFRISFGILAFVLLILLRSIRWIILPAIIVAVSIKSTEAILVLSETKLSMVSAILNSLVTIIGVATTTHLAVRFRQHREQHDPKQSLILTMSELLGPIFWDVRDDRLRISGIALQ